ncbi:DUF4358 domain-containing protein [Sporofaciens sp. SGI.106]|uniref:DUF4358 domain-containing protein n=1 Tax=Sporofaciens sp. SGI.106 TaxID=3420568 RepID=UPI002A9D66E3|nr:DUF4358 domain-containing protein [Lachnoclostridium sp.]
MKKKFTGELDIINICKYGMVLVFAVYIGLLLAMNADSQTAYDVVESAVFGSCDLEGLEKADSMKIRKYYGFYDKDYDGVTLYTSKDAMGAEEILLVHTNDLEQMTEVVESIEDRISRQKNNFDGYGTEQMKLLDQSVVDQKGRYILMAISPDAEKIREAFRKAL